LNIVYNAYPISRKGDHTYHIADSVSTVILFKRSLAYILYTSAEEGFDGCPKVETYDLRTDGSHTSSRCTSSGIGSRFLVAILGLSTASVDGNGFPVIALKAICHPP